MKVIGSLHKWNESELVAIIGPRKASKAECNAAYWLAKKCAEKGKIVVSGLAEGIDTYAHKGALDGGGQTIAVLSTAIEEKIFPESNQELAEKIMENGALLHPFAINWRKADMQYGRILHQKPRYILRLLERDILLAHMCPIIMAVSNKKITGGTRWGVNYGLVFNKKVLQYNEKANLINLRYLKATVDWETELKLPVN
ncbi:DNA-processing protein DprA [Priestia aryabhattai]